MQGGEDVWGRNWEESKPAVILKTVLLFAVPIPWVRKEGVTWLYPLHPTLRLEDSPGEPQHQHSKLRMIRTNI